MSSQASAPGRCRVGGVVDALDAAVVAVAGVQGGPVYALCDADVEAAIEQAQVLAARVFDATLVLVREADERDLGRRLGAASTAAWLAGRYRIRPGQARTLVRLANQTRPDDGPVDYAANVRTAETGRELRATGAALSEGAISAEHAMVVAKIMERVPPAIAVEEARAAEAELAGFCGQHDPGTVAKLGDYLLAVMAEDTLDDADDERRRRRTLRLNETTGGISGCLSSEGMAILRTALDPLAAPNPGRDGERDPRTPGQRLIDALVELARRAIAANSFETNHGIAHRVLVTIGLDALTGDHPHPEPDNGSKPGTDGPASDTPATNHAGSGVPDTASSNIGQPATNGADSSGSRGVDDTDISSAENAGSDRNAAQRTNSNSPISGGRGSSTGSGRTIGGDGAALPPFGRHPHPPTPGEIQWGGLISPAAARRIACCAGIQRILLDPAGAVLDVGREYRTATPAQFAALIARDRGCAFPGCTRPPAWCIAHHIIHWADGGETNLDNLVLLCTWHHTVVHHHGWDVRLGPDRLPDFYPPPWVDPDREPRRNSRPRYGLATGTPYR